MPLVQIENGKVVDSTAAASSATDKKSNAESKSTSGLGKEAFLQLLVAQMQYQDPLEPMDNTEYISQLATFSQLEAIQNMTDKVSYSMANELVGKYVILNTPSGTVNGKVDYVMYENGDVYLAVNDGLYSIDDLDTVADGEYYEAFQMASLLSSMIARLPSEANLTASHAKDVKAAREIYDSMNQYQKGFVSKEDLDKLEKLEKKLKELTGSSDSDSTDSPDKTDPSDETDSSDSTDKKDEVMDG